MKRGAWTAPYYGVQHFQVTGAAARPQFTIEDRGSLVNAYVLGLTGFTPIREVLCDNVVDAQAWIEKQAAVLLLGS